MLPVLILTLLAVLAFPSYGPRGSARTVPWWTTHCLDKVKADSPVPAEPTRRVDLFAGRNEFEAFQIVLRGNGADLQDLDVSISDFRTAGGDVISRQHVTPYLVGFMNIERPSSIEGSTGLWPDPLVPRVDRYTRESRDAFPFSIRAGRNQPLWIELYVPRDAKPGAYSASAMVSSNGRRLFSVPINLTVWSFTLPSTSTLKSSFGLNGVTALKRHRGRFTTDEDLYSLTRLYAKAALLHRLSIHGGSMAPPKVTTDGGRMKIDWGPYDAEVGPFLDGTVLSEKEPLYGARATSVEIRTPSALESNEEKIEFWTQWTNHFKEKGWYDRLFLYLWDEPPAADYPKVLKSGQASVRVDPRVRNLVTVPFTNQLADVVHIWVPLVNCLEPKPGPDNFCDEIPPLDIYAGEIGRGKSLWFYQSCASHGCNIVGGKYFTGWPSYMIDIHGASNRVMQWVAWKYRIEGELYFNMNEAYGRDVELWNSLYLVGGNGDGTLFYPGRPEQIGGSSHIPVESIRLKLIREGMEDYEYLALLARAGGADLADQYANRIVKKSYIWESNAEVFLDVRREMGEMLNRLAP